MISYGTESPPLGEQGYSHNVFAWSDTSFSRGDTIARLVISAAYTVTVEGEPVSLPLPWTGFNDSFGLIGDRLAVGFGKWAELLVYAPNGRREKEIRWHPKPEPVEAGDRSQYAEKRRAFFSRHGSDPNIRGLFPSLREIDDVPTQKPFFDGLLVDDEGNIWVRGFPSTSIGSADSYSLSPDSDLPPQQWTVFDSSGVWLGDIVMPTRFELHTVARGRVFGVQRDSVDVESVVGIRIVR